MKRIKTRKLSIERLTVDRLDQQRGGGYVWLWNSYDAGCSNSCNSCQDHDDCGGHWYSMHIGDCL